MPFDEMMDQSGEQRLRAAVKIQWFPGHMAKTRRLIAENISQVDVVAELLDSRIPFSSQNPLIKELLGNKPRLVLLNKTDLADPGATAQWCNYFEKNGVPALPISALSDKFTQKLTDKCRELCAEKLKRDAEKGMNKPVRLMVVGIPNVGKSSVINRLCGRNRAKVEDRPGVTRGKQWLRISDKLELLDTPGILWPKFEDPDVGLALAFTGAVRDEVMDLEAVAAAFLERVASTAPKALVDRYKLDATEGLDGFTLLEAVGKKRGFFLRGGVIDTERTATIVLDEYRGGKLGRLTLELPELWRATV